MNKAEIDRINNLTFKELRSELVLAKGDPLKEYLIRNLMLIRYNRHIHNKHQPIITKPIIKTQFNQIDVSDLVDDLMNDNQEIIEELHDNRPIVEYERDKANNNLMERLNNDMDIRNTKINKKKPEFLLPYSNDPGENYASIKDVGIKSKNNFSNTQFSK